MREQDVGSSTHAYHTMPVTQSHETLPLKGSILPKSFVAREVYNTWPLGAMPFVFNEYACLACMYVSDVMPTEVREYWIPQVAKHNKTKWKTKLQQTAVKGWR